MPLTPFGLRLAAVIANVGILATALTIRARAGGDIAQYSGTALYTSIVYGTTVFLWPRIRPLAAAAAATGFSWLVEGSQLTGIPAYLSQHSVAARLVLGVRFDFTDILWYPAGALLMFVLHWTGTRTESIVRAARSTRGPQPRRSGSARLTGDGEGTQPAHRKVESGDR